ncbi:MAG: HEPN domain-containing protein [Verrucomicrobiia bacterium]
MIKLNLNAYVAIWGELDDLESVFFLAEHTDDPLTADEIKDLLAALTKLKLHCETLEAKASVAQIEMSLNDVPKTGQALKYLLSVVRNELRTRQFLFMPTDCAPWYENDALLTPEAKQAFPRAHNELRQAGNSLAFDLFDASVFHSMRSLEHALRAVAARLGATFPFPIELADWQNIIEQIESKIRAMPGPKISGNYDKQFFSEAAAQFMHFKEAWRNHVAHGRAIYNQSQATHIIEHVRQFIGHISLKVAEQP